MCTLTWRHGEGGYDLFFNRDERRTRKQEAPPEIIEFEGHRLIAPRDGDHSGTWLAVNAYGITYALLNHYDLMARLPDPPDPMSRGLIPLKFAVKRDSDDDELGVPLNRFRPFHLVKIGPRDVSTNQSWMWDGETFRASCPDTWELPMLTTSSYDSGRAVQLRKAALRKCLPSLNREVLERFHRTTSPHGPAYGVLMRREDAQTMSITHVHVNGEEVVVSYQAMARDSEMAQPDEGGSEGLRSMVTRMPRRRF